MIHQSSQSDQSTDQTSTSNATEDEDKKCQVSQIQEQAPKDTTKRQRLLIKSKDRAKTSSSSSSGSNTPCAEITIQKSPSNSSSPTPSPNPQEHEQEISTFSPRALLPPPQSLETYNGIERHSDLSDDCFTYSDEEEEEEEEEEDGLYADAVAAAAAALAESKTRKKLPVNNWSAKKNPTAFSSPSSSPSSSVTSSSSPLASSPKLKGRRRKSTHRRRKRGQRVVSSQLPSLVEVREDAVKTPNTQQSLGLKEEEERRSLGGVYYNYGAVSSVVMESTVTPPKMSPKKRGLEEEGKEVVVVVVKDPTASNIFSPGSTASTTTSLTDPPVSPSGRRANLARSKLLRSSGSAGNGGVLSPLSDSAEVKSGVVGSVYSSGEVKQELWGGGAAPLFRNYRGGGSRRSSSRRLMKRMEEEEIRKEQAVRALWGEMREEEEEGEDVGSEEGSVSGFCGKEKRRRCGGKDALFGVLFVLQLAAIIFCAGWFGPSAVRPLDDPNSEDTEENDYNGTDGTFYNPWKNLADDDFFISGAAFGGKTWNTSGTRVHIDYMTVIKLTCVTGTYASVLSVLTIGFMMILAKSLIHVALIFAVIVSLAWCIVGGLLSEYSLVPFLGIIAFALCVGYAVVVWERVPFAATILNTALYGMRCTADIVGFSLVMTIVAFGWTVLWMLAFIGVYDYINDLRKENRLSDGGDGVLFFVFSLSYYWTFQVIKNIVQVTVAGTMGAWWFHPEQVSPCCSRTVNKSLIKAMTSSFGSICFGSLVVHPAQVISRLIIVFFPHLDRVPSSVLCFRRSGDAAGSVGSWESSEAENLNGLQDNDPRPRSERALQGFTGRLTSVFNHWAFTYIGLHNHDSFLDAGKNATTLFEIREWTQIVADSLIHNVLFLSSFVIGGSAGCFGLMVEEVDGYSFTSFNKPMITAFLIGTFIGFSLSNVFLNIVASAVNTVLLCYAAAPFEFHQNHRQLSNEMKDSWNERWSDNFV